MQPLFAIHNNVSLLSVTIAPSTFLAALTLALVFLSLYLPRLPPLPRLFNFRQRRTSNSDKDIVLQRHQRIVRDPGVFEIGDDDNSGALDAQLRRNRELLFVDWRHRQLPPLPPPPFRPLPRERGEIEDDHEDQQPVFRKKRSSRSDRDKAKKDKEREKEKPKLRAKPEKRSSNSGSGGGSSKSIPPRKKHNSSVTATATTASAELVVRSGRREHLGVYDSLSESSDSSDREERGRTKDQFRDSVRGDIDGSIIVNSHSDAGSWLMPAISPYRELPLHPPHLQQQHHQKNQSRPQTFGYPSNHSGLLETDTEENESVQDSASIGGYSPPAWRRLENGDRSAGFWRKSDNILGSPTLTPKQPAYEQQHQQQHQQFSLPPPPMPPHLCTSPLQQHLHRRKQSRADRLFSSRGSSPSFDSDDEDVVADVIGFDDDDIFDNDGGGVNCGGGVDNFYVDDVLEQAMRTRLPGSISPDKERSPEPELLFPSAASRMEGLRFNSAVPVQEKASLESQEPSENYIRFAVRAEVQHRTELIESTIGFVRGKVHFVTRSWAHIIVSMLVGILSFAAMRALSQPAGLRPVPDLVKVAGIARSFEPLIYYSEHGATQVHDLEATGVAVWDLGESVRLSNLTSAPIIVKELDDLSETLNTLAMELTKFFANIDSDIDGILIVMDWARRELSQLQQLPSSSSPSLLLLRPLTFAYDNIHNLLTITGLLENASTGSPTVAGAMATTMFGMSGPQRTRETLRRTFHEFLVVLEEAVATELQHSMALFALFEAIDRQFLNLARTVVREASVQDERYADLLSSLWTRILGPSVAATSKYERNRELLHDVREKTVRNKGILVEHNHRLLALKTSLESLRRKLVSPLVRSVNSSTLTLDEQIRGLEEVGVYLDRVRMRQKGKLMETLYGASAQRDRVGWGTGSGGSGGGYYYDDNMGNNAHGERSRMTIDNSRR